MSASLCPLARVRALYKHLLAQLQSHFLEIGKCNESPTVNVNFRLDEMLPVHAIAREQVRRNFAMSSQTSQTSPKTHRTSLNSFGGWTISYRPDMNRDQAHKRIGPYFCSCRP